MESKRINGVDPLLHSDHRSILAAPRDGPVAARLSVIRGKLSELQRLHAAAVLADTSAACCRNIHTA